MEQKNWSITWKTIVNYFRMLLPELEGKKIYGIPRGGATILAYCTGVFGNTFKMVDTPEEADIIFDDLVDSGETKAAYLKKYPDKQFYSLFEKINKSQWFHFPYEESGEQDVESNVRRILQFFDQSEREGLKDTPRRYIKFLKEFLSPPEFKFTTFDSEGYSQMITQVNIPFYSLCEHHIAPFFGHANIAYIPDKKIVGLSKLARTVETYSRRFQNQERITMQIAKRLSLELEPKGVAVLLKAQHMCMEMRGVKKHNTKTITTTLLGAFKQDQKVREEFLNMIQ